MALMAKGNRQIKVSAERKKEYLKRGYNEIDEKGNVVTPSETNFPAEAKKAMQNLNAENDKLKAELEAPKKEAEAAKAEVEKLQVENDKLKAEEKKLREDVKALKKEQ